MDMFYTMSSDNVMNSKSSTAFERSLKGTTPRGLSNISIPLDNILGRYSFTLQSLHRERSKQLFRTRRKQLNPMSLYVLTDEVWEPECDPSRPIMTLIKTLVDLELFDKQISLHFIGFETSIETSQKLKDLEESISRSILSAYPSSDGLL